MIHENVLSRIRNTPLVEIRRLNPNPRVRIVAKLECVNPGGSIKDRVALAMIEAAEASGELTPDKTIIEATSGNTGIGLAMVAAVKGYRIRLLMSESASEERKKILRAFGAEIGFTPGRLGTDGAIEEAYRLMREEPDKYVLMDQYNNPASIQAHYNGTGLEIWDQTEGQVTHFICALGTTGTAMGCTKRLKEMNPEIFCAAVEPHPGHKIQGLKNMHESYPPGIFNRAALDAVLHVEDEVAFDYCRRLAREEGILAGMSSGAALAGAIQLAQGLDSGLIAVIFPDSGERYLSTALFSGEVGPGIQLDDVASGHKTVLTLAGGRKLCTIGPSLDNPAGLAAWRRVVLLDVLARSIEAKGETVVMAAGLADMDDRTLAASRAAGEKRADFARSAREGILARAARLGVRKEALWPLASDAVDSALALCRKLLSRGLAYEKLRSVYFDVFRDKRYGEVSGMDLNKISAGRTVDLDAYVKESPHDFTLLKRASLQDLKLGEVLNTEWGNVRPSWFLQHAAAALDALGRVDVFLGSEAHRFPHLENLRAIWSIAGVEPTAWLIDQPVTCEDGATDLDAVEAVLGCGHAARMWLLSTSYHRELPCSEAALAMWARNWRRVQEAAGVLRLTTGGGAPAGEEVHMGESLLESLDSALEDDLSLHRFWPALFAFAKQVNAWAGEGRLTPGGARQMAEALARADAVLCVLDPDHLPLRSDELPESAVRLLAERAVARGRKDFVASDRLRHELALQGFRVEDGLDGVRVFRIPV